MSWIKPSERLPQEGKYVLIRVPGRPWNDSDDPNGVFTKVAQLVRGVEYPEGIYRFGDKWGNNLVPYAWREFGPGSYNGQEVTHWMEIPELPDNRAEALDQVTK